MSYERILVPTDGSTHAERATDQALSLASAFDATVHALGVVNVGALAGPYDWSPPPESFIDRYRKQAKKNLEHVEAQWTHPDRYHGEVREGRPSSVILDYISEADIDLVAMGTHGRTGLERFVLGSVAEHVLRASPIPILVTRAVEDESPTLPYQNVLIPTDGSECASGAVDHALAIASATDATAHVINVFDSVAYSGEPGSDPPADFLETVERAGTEAIEAVAERFEAAGVDAKTVVMEGRASNGILSYAEDNDIDAVIMGTHGRSRLDRFLLGSTTERVIRRSDLPVIAVPEAKGE
ncbi:MULTISPECIES: universal stress protein [Salinibaculum]|uniref:universal stress protein n=1 Tax=Salinibaculum TaxID=2732368 RepID=UPI0030D4D0C6